MRGASDKLAALATMSLAQLRGDWLQAFRAPAPEGVGRTLLMLGISYKLQEKLHGRLASTVARELDRLATRRDRNEDLGEEPTARLKLGTWLVREWQGQSHQIELTESGYLYGDRLNPGS